MGLGPAASEDVQHLDPEGYANSIFEWEPGKSLFKIQCRSEREYDTGASADIFLPDAPDMGGEKVAFKTPGNV